MKVYSRASESSCLAGCVPLAALQPRSPQRLTFFGLSVLQGHKVVGYDLQGNQYLEKAASGAGERPKRVMEYREELEGRDVHISDYTDGRKVPGASPSAPARVELDD